MESPDWTVVGADLVFARADGSPLDPDTVSGQFERAVRRLRLPPIRLHDLRHTHATLALAAGVHPKVVQERLGHSSIQITLDRYSHAVPGLQADAAGRIAAIVDGAPWRPSGERRAPVPSRPATR